MKKLALSDISMRLGNNGLSFREKLEVAKRLDELKVDGIEIAPSFDDKADLVLVRTMTTFVKNSTVVCFAGKTAEEIDKVWEALSGARNKRLAIAVPASFAQMEYAYHLKPAQVLDTMRALVKHAKTLCCDVEVSFEDATRGDVEFLAKLISAAVEEGATVISISDNAGNYLPDEYYAFLTSVYEKTPALCNAKLAIQCNNSLYMAAACAFAGVKAGAEIVKCSITGGNVPKLDNIAQTLSLTGDRLKVKVGLNTTELSRAASRIAMLTKMQKDGEDKAVKESDAENIRHDASFGELMNIIKNRGYDLSAEDSAKVYEEFVKLSKKKSVNLKELDFIIASNALQIPATYKLNNYVINSGNIIVSTAGVSLTKDGAELYGLSNGDGPIDAAFKAIETITGHHYELDDFQIQSVTEGREAIGEALVKLRDNGKLYSGRGVSTDIIGASVKAYLNALNKIVYEEKQV
ncbi:MAG TPA: alpha-isopropylmalate synthase regulatory domain-containing protein [Clostridia bacterium]|nr:alpha-isopropylmalate synthase regulatory domain-containing protein [Clostridia bacterium]